MRSPARFIINLSLISLFAGFIQAQDTLAVTANGFTSYTIDGESNPTLTLIRGNTYVFQVSAPGHPFWINSTAGTGTNNAFSDGVTGNGTSSGFITFAVPESAPDQLFYNCQFHSAMTGMINITSTVDISNDVAVPEQIFLSQNFPNPFNPSTKINYFTSREEFVNLSIYSVTGTLVRTLFKGFSPAGNHSAEWNGMTDTGSPAAAGIYFYRMVTPSGAQTRQMVLLK